MNTSTSDHLPCVRCLDCGCCVRVSVFKVEPVQAEKGRLRLMDGRTHVQTKWRKGRRGLGLCRMSLKGDIKVNIDEACSRPLTFFLCFRGLGHNPFLNPHFILTRTADKFLRISECHVMNDEKKKKRVKYAMIVVRIYWSCFDFCQVLQLSRASEMERFGPVTADLIRDVSSHSGTLMTSAPWSSLKGVRLLKSPFLPVKGSVKKKCNMWQEDLDQTLN